MNDPTEDDHEDVGNVEAQEPQRVRQPGYWQSCGSGRIWLFWLRPGPVMNNPTEDDFEDVSKVEAQEPQRVRLRIRTDMASLVGSGNGCE